MRNTLPDELQPMRLRFADGLTLSDMLERTTTSFEVTRYALCYEWVFDRRDRLPEYLIYQTLNGECMFVDFPSSADVWGMVTYTDMLDHFGSDKMRSKYHGETRPWVRPLRRPYERRSGPPIVSLRHKDTAFDKPMRPSDTNRSNPRAHALIRKLFEVDSFYVGRRWFHVAVLHNPLYLCPGEFIDMSHDVRQWRKEEHARRANSPS